METVPDPREPVSQQPAPPRGALREVLGLPVILYRLHLGWVLGHRFLLLVHRGRKTGIVRRVVLEVIGRDEARRESLVVAGWGTKTQWLGNVEAGGAIEVLTGRERFRPEWRVLGQDEAVAALAAYERRNRWMRPVVHRALGYLLGWRYDGTDGARRRAMAQLRVVAFRPADLRT